MNQEMPEAKDTDRQRPKRIARVTRPRHPRRVGPGALADSYPKIDGKTWNRREYIFSRWCRLEGYPCLLIRDLSRDRHPRSVRGFWRRCPPEAREALVRAYGFIPSEQIRYARWLFRKTTGRDTALPPMKWLSGRGLFPFPGKWCYYPDFFVVFSERQFGFVEVKSDRGQLNQGQRSVFPELVEKAGQRVWLVRVEPGTRLRWYRIDCAGEVVSLSGSPADSRSKDRQAK